MLLSTQDACSPLPPPQQQEEQQQLQLDQSIIDRE
jgi:hypothetical protein